MVDEARWESDTISTSSDTNTDQLIRYWEEKQPNFDHCHLNWTIIIIQSLIIAQRQIIWQWPLSKLVVDDDSLWPVSIALKATQGASAPCSSLAGQFAVQFWCVGGRGLAARWSALGRGLTASNGDSRAPGSLVWAVNTTQVLEHPLQSCPQKDN